MERRRRSQSSDAELPNGWAALLRYDELQCTSRRIRRPSFSPGTDPALPVLGDRSAIRDVLSSSLLRPVRGDWRRLRLERARRRSPTRHQHDVLQVCGMALRVLVTAWPAPCWPDATASCSRSNRPDPELDRSVAGPCYGRRLRPSGAVIAAFLQRSFPPWAGTGACERWLVNTVLGRRHAGARDRAGGDRTDQSQGPESAVYRCKRAWSRPARFRRQAPSRFVAKGGHA